MEGQEHLPIVDLRKKRIDLAERNELGLRDVVVQRLDDRLGKVLIEREQGHAGSRGCEQIPAESLLQVDCLEEPDGRDVRIEALDPVLPKTALAQRQDRDRLEPRVRDVR